MVKIEIVDDRREIHPKFNNPDADIILSSKGRTLYSIHRFTLISASNFFKRVLSNATGAKEGSITTARNVITITANTEAVDLPFADGPLERVFLMMTLQKVPPIQSIQELEDTLDVMEYLDAQGLLTHMHAFCFAPVLLSEPIRLYSIGAKFGWEDVMQYAAEHSLHLNLFPSGDVEAAEIQKQLSRLDGGSYHRLLRLHRRRRDDFRAFLKANLSRPLICRPCGSTPADNTKAAKSVEALIIRLVWEIDQNPSGDTVLSSLDAEDKNTGACGRCGNYVDDIEIEATVKRGIAGLPRNLA